MRVHGDGADPDTMRTNNGCMLIYPDVWPQLGEPTKYRSLISSVVSG